MAGIGGIGGLPELVRTTPAANGERHSGPAQADAPKDGVFISAEAQQASYLADLTAISDRVAEIRQERVEEARQEIEAGAHRIQQFVRVVAQRISHVV